jgi:hypothetical protein
VVDCIQNENELFVREAGLKALFVSDIKVQYSKLKTAIPILKTAIPRHFFIHDE